MLHNATGFQRVYIAAGYTNLRRGIDGLASIVKFSFQLDPYEKDILFLFCGRRSDRIKGLVWEGDGSLLLHKRLELGGFSWPRTKEGALEITPEQYQALMQGLEIVSRHPIQECIPRISCKALCKTEKIKNLFAFIVLDKLEVIHSWVLLHSFNYGVLW
ncbi:MAG TPA: IS66 family insertion sequence element accessory protein TnpB [Candidatus Eisenbergiella merdipullorum]|uniref:IS66 family insertion sequence element accessory protein TnpB n=1 Tax=Candidatus Eisenbergiella merdipullorum TaxID=2838553 RepID=A0A9D2I6K9_9FIRM|nr:IS66 family insertion sequence element accessory protein TnpB [Candidatus Eisenbergiella merdipullorum]